MNIEAVGCQKIVNRVINILGKNINIMNDKGIIIASGDEERIGTFHEAAKIAVESNSEIIVDNNIRFKGCKKGVNLPIYHNNRILGVIGITGEPAEVKGYGIIVKELVELMIQEDERKKTEMFQAKALMNFANELIKEQDKQSLEMLRLRSQLIDFDLRTKRIIIVADICNFSNAIKSCGKDQEIIVQQLKQGIIDNVSNILSRQYDLIFNLSEDRFIIFKYFDTDILPFCRKAEELLKANLGLTMYIGIGSPCSDISDYYNSYMLANRVVNIGRKLDSKKLIYSSDDYRIQLLLQSVKEDQKKEYVEYFYKLFNNESDKHIKELFNTARIYFEKGMNIKATAESMYIHRNTVLYRINKLKQKYGQDITEPYTCMMLYIAITLMNLE